jgi:hypothetical protein
MACSKPRVACWDPAIPTILFGDARTIPEEIVRGNERQGVGRGPSGPYSSALRSQFAALAAAS